MENLKTQQIEFWSGAFGKEYTDRNPQSAEERDTLYVNKFGFTRTQLNTRFIGHLPKSFKILEVGCNIGNQLAILQKMGFENLYGIELQSYAVEKAKQLTSGINIIQGSGFDIPFRDNYFDIVFTGGVLIHINPDDLGKIMDEIYRCTKKYIWGSEYYSQTIENIKYRGHDGFMWKADYADTFLKRFPDLNLVNKEVYSYITESEKGNKDCMYLLEKQ